MTFLPDIELVLDDFFVSSIKHADKIDKGYGDLWRELHRLHKAGGKRLRPQLVMLSFEAYGGKDIPTIIPVAAAQELIHFSMLIHDDIIDRDVIRYGVNNISGSYRKIYGPYVKKESELIHYANSAAIMAGDLMIAGAHKLIVDSLMSDPKKIVALQTMYDGIFDVAGGELLDTESSFRSRDSDKYLTIAHYKTASYSFVRPLVIGALLADASAVSINKLFEFANDLGIAYQLSDDLLGVFGDETKTGKSNSGDIREGKWTLLATTTYHNLSDSDKAIFESYFGKATLTKDQLNIIKILMKESGAKQYVIETLRDYIEKSRTILKSLKISERSRKQFEELVTMLLNRQY